jgi:glutamate synthase domain-containing protein 3
VAARVLAEFDRLRESFVKVMPRDYKRVLREQAEAAEPAGSDEAAVERRRLRA